jgi:protein TonB
VTYSHSLWAHFDNVPSIKGIRSGKLANTARKDQQDATAERKPAPGPQPRTGKLPILLLTSDDSLWPQIGHGLRDDLQLKQVDNLDELLVSVPAGQSAVVLWDARAEDAPAGALSRLQLHSAHFATVALASADTAAIWNPMVSRNQLVAWVPAPFDSAGLRKAIDAAVAEVEARVALLGSGKSAAPPSAPGKSKTPVLAAALVVSLVAVAVAVYWKTNQGAAEKPDGAGVGATSAAGSTPQVPGKAAAGTDDKVFQLLESAQQAMRERRYIDPAAGSAIALYHEVLLYDPGNEEAHQGMQRLAEILFSRVQSALDERKFDLALQSLETARSIDPGDRRIAAIDARIAAMRSEIGSAQILAALNAQAFDRADQLLDDAARNKSLPDAKIAQLREETAHRRSESVIDGLLKLVDARLQQDRLVEPHNDNATYYLEEARRAGATAAGLQSRSQDLARRLRAHDAAASATANPATGNPAAKAKADEPSVLDLVEARLNQGQILEPDHDNALYYLNQLSAADPKNAGLAQLTSAVQSQIVTRANAALAAGQTENAKTLLQTAESLGDSPEIAALTARLTAAKGPKDAAPAAPLQIDANLLRPIDRLSPEYPRAALLAGTEGWVDLAFTVNVDGTVTDVSVLNSTPRRIFDRAAQEALARTRYQPFLQDGHPIAVSSRLRVSFHMAKH